ncbi:hypothetical protein HY640_01190 [Candidatus Woesearchaeota archaeon]|nr:hypothetical protein [Candidatus Woesearchaeota archaeon]
MKRRVALVFFLAASVFIAGCAQGPNNVKTTPFCGGLDGVEVKFVEGSPPLEVFDGNQFPFDVSLRLLNKGEQDIEVSQSKVELSGISNVDFGGPVYVKVVSERIPGKSKDQEGNCREANPVIVSFGSSGEEPFRYRQVLPGNTQFPLRVDVCYSYRTRASAQFCVQRELPRFGQEPTCKVDEVKAVSNSGSPLHVENFRQSPGGQSKIAFSFDLVHKGTGAIHSGDLCDSRFQNRNRVRVRVTSNVGRITCTSLGGGNEGDVTLTENKKFVSCFMDASGVSGREFETPLSIELFFNYKQHEDTTILVKSAGVASGTPSPSPVPTPTPTPTPSVMCPGGVGACGGSSRESLSSCSGQWLYPGNTQYNEWCRVTAGESRSYCYTCSVGTGSACPGGVDGCGGGSREFLPACSGSWNYQYNSQYDIWCRANAGESRPYCYTCSTGAGIGGTVCPGGTNACGNDNYGLLGTTCSIGWTYPNNPTWNNWCLTNAGGSRAYCYRCG